MRQDVDAIKCNNNVRDGFWRSSNPSRTTVLDNTKRQALLILGMKRVQDDWNFQIILLFSNAKRRDVPFCPAL
jgi:hypothetical protein